MLFRAAGVVPGAILFRKIIWCYPVDRASFKTNRLYMVKRPETSQTDEKAVFFVEAMFNQLNWVANRLYQDFGLDIHVKVFESSRSRKGTPWEFYIKSKVQTSFRNTKVKGGES